MTTYKVDVENTYCVKDIKTLKEALDCFENAKQKNKGKRIKLIETMEIELMEEKQ